MSQSGALPRLIASGRGAIAEQILQIAWQKGIYIRRSIWSNKMRSGNWQGRSTR